MHIYFMRHGHSITDIENKIESLYDSVLTETGVEQAKEASIYFKLKGIVFDEILSSPLLRAKETAEIIGNAQKITPTVLNSLKEVDRGILCGMNKKEADDLYPRSEFKNFTDLYPQESGENTYDVRSRSYKAINEVMKRKTNHILVVSHGAILNEIMLSLLSMPSLINEKHGYMFSFDDCEYMHLMRNINSEKLALLEKRVARRD